MFYIFIIVLIFLLFLLIEYGKREVLPYYKNNGFITNAELSFFKALEQAVGDRYYIFPQVNLASIVKVNARGRDWWRYFGKISRKSIDFILAEKSSCMPVVAIELDDSSHFEFARQKRDNFINRVFEKINLPILHISCKSGYNIVQLQEEIQSILNNVTKGV